MSLVANVFVPFYPAALITPSFKMMCFYWVCSLLQRVMVLWLTIGW